MRGMVNHHSNRRTLQIPRAPEYEMASSTQSPYSRQPFGIDSTINYEDEPSASYNAQASSAYMLPNSPQVYMADYCGLGWNSKGWPPVLQGSRAPAETLFSESDPENTMSTPAYPYMITGQGQQANEAFSMAPSQSSLAPSVRGTERTLPNPFGHAQSPGNATVSDGLPSVQDYRPGNRMVSGCEPRTFLPPASNMPSAAPIDRKLVPSTGPDMALGFLPVAPNNATSLLPSSESFGGLEATTCVTEPGDDFRGTTDNRYRAFAQDDRRMMSFADCRPDTYGYNRSAYRNRSEAGGSSPEDTMISGLPYERPSQPATLSLVDEKHPMQTLAGHPTYTGLCSQ